MYRYKCVCNINYYISSKLLRIPVNNSSDNTTRGGPPVHYTSGAKVIVRIIIFQLHYKCLFSVMQELEYSVLQNKVDALSDVVKNNEETQVYTNKLLSYYFLQHKRQNLKSIEHHKASIINHKHDYIY